ncbi:AAA family ATPase [Candidatus Micrarchaeota archaeon]|nr:AAA family ATPase [Candidatus Micrarchaeota archaeon]MBU1165421.1 AAA family ATPase [Candidatus Micrarchaeota archaeon]MBU1886968.1 AAA family ATPase [Candidatus Micrarchaeota archaeon]
MQKQQSLAGQQVIAHLALAQKNEKLWSSVLVFLGALLTLGTFQFYPIYIVFILAAACGAVAWRMPPGGVILGAILLFPAIIFQSSVLGWFYLLILAAIFFQVMEGENWKIISTLQILIMAPFAFGAIPFAGIISIIGMAIGALYFGSKKSVAISLPSVLMILLLSSIWLIPNSAYLPLRIDTYGSANPALQIDKPVVELMNMGSEILTAFARFMSFENIGKIWSSVSIIVNNIIRLAMYDSLILQLVAWGIALYLLGYLPSKIKKRSQLIGSFSLLILIPMYYVIGVIYDVGLGIEFVAEIVLTILILGIFEQIGMNVSRESEIQRKDKMKSYGKFGMKDMSLSGEEKSMDDVGGYEDVKEELRDSIMMPLERKDIAYSYGIKPPAGILLFGPPGTGKTMLMRALAKELKYNFIEVRSSQILSQWVGESLPYTEKIVIKDQNGLINTREIGKIVEEKQNIEVLSFDNNGKIRFSKIKDWIKHKSTSHIYEVRTRTGRRIKVTDYHSLFTLNGMKIESIPTSKLVPKESYIAIPNKMNFSSKPIRHIDLLKNLKKNDYGLFVKNPKDYVKQAIAKLGRKKVANILGYRTPDYLSQILHHKVGVRVSRFLKLMEITKISPNSKNILIGAGSKKLPGIIKIDEKLATFIGLWIAEGSYNREDTVRISVSDKEIKTISKLCRELFGKVTVYKKKNSRGRDIYIGSRPLYVLLHHVLGLEHGADKKKMPAISFSLSRKNLAALLRGYFSGDGTAHENDHGVGRVECSTTSKELADQLMYLLLYFEIVGTLSSKKEWNGSISHRVGMIGGPALTKFKEINFLNKYKKDRIEKYIEQLGWFRDQQIPITGNLRETVQQKLPKWSNSATIGRGIIMEADLGEEIKEFIKNDIYLDRVEEIKQLDDEDFVYDVSVDPCQNFVAGMGGIFAHNSEKNVKEIFDNARKNAPSILFFDEIDSLAKKRSSESLDEVGPRVLSELLQQVDGATKTKDMVMVIGATNRPNALDAAILRPGRLDKIIYMHLPDPEARRAILEVHLRRLPVEEDINLDLIVKKTERFSGADLKNVISEAKNIAAKEATIKGVIVPITMKHIMQIVNNVKPSTGLAQIDEYNAFRLDFERRTGSMKQKEEETAKETNVKWSDVAGLDDVKEALLEAIELPLLHEKEMKDFKVKPSKGILLFGPPGTGKTLIVKAASNELNASFQSLSGAEIMKKGYTGAVGIIKETFNRARENSPAIIFVDEIETFAPARGMGGGSEIIGQFLTEMDGVRGMKGVVVIAATNKPQMMDAAIMRPGRFDKIFYIPPPSEKGRAEIFKIHLGEFAANIDMNKLAGITDGFSGADIAEICQTAKMKSLRATLKSKPEKITANTLLGIIKNRRPSITKALLSEYEQFLEAYGERR